MISEASHSAEINARLWTAGLAALAVLGFAGCAPSTAADAEPAAEGAAGTSTGAPNQTPTPEAQPPSTTPTVATPTLSAASRPITLTFAGDVHFEGPLESVLDDPATGFRSVAAPLSAADITVVNLETSVGTGGRREPKRFTFQAPPEAFDALAAAGIDVVTMANNHAMDFGRGGLEETLAAIAADPPLSVVGIGADAAAAFAPAFVDVGATTVAIIGAHSADDPRADPTAQWAADDRQPGVAVARDPARLVTAVRATRQAADLVVVFMHWGVQGEQCPSRSQRATARALADAGADVIVGSHAHVVQGAGLLGDTYIAYGLGNFLWYQPGTTALLTLTIDGGRVVDETWTAGRIGADGLARLEGGDDAKQLARDLGQRRACTDLAPL